MQNQKTTVFITRFKQFSKEGDSFSSPIFTLREQSPLEFSSAFWKLENIFYYSNGILHFLHSQNSKKYAPVLVNSTEEI